MIDVGCRVLKRGWGQYEAFQYLARYGRVVDVREVEGMVRAEVRWDSAAESREPFRVMCGGAPAQFTLEQPDDLLWLWWRSA